MEFLSSCRMDHNTVFVNDIENPPFFHSTSIEIETIKQQLIYPQLSINYVPLDYLNQ